MQNELHTESLVSRQKRISTTVEGFVRPCFTIAIAMYNAERYIKKCLSSIVQQSFQNFEVVVVDDASTDLSLNIAKCFAEKDSRFKVYTNCHRGAYATKIEALEHSRGEYIICCDADDYFVDNAFEILHNIAKANEFTLIQFNYYIKYNHIKLKNKTHYRKIILDGNKFKDQEYTKLICGEHDTMLLKGNLWGKIYHRSVLDNLPPPSKREDVFMGDDWLLNMYLLKDCASALFIDTPLYIYRIMAGNSCKFRKNALKDLDCVKRYQYEFIEVLGHNKYEKAEYYINLKIAKDLFFYTKSCCLNDISQDEIIACLRTAFAYPTFAKAIEYFRRKTHQNNLWIDLIRKANPYAYIEAARNDIKSESPVKTLVHKIKYIIKRL